MQVGEIVNPALSGGPPPKPKKSSKDEFLTLLVAQLKNQNPLEPQSGSEFIAQLAQFSSVEQGAKTNSLLSDMRAEQISASSAALAGFVGKAASFKTDVLNIQDVSAGVPDVNYELSVGSKSASAVILDSDGNAVRTIDLGALPPGTHTVQWDGKDRLGQDVPEGAYRIEIRVDDAAGNPSVVPTDVSGVIDSIDFSKGYPMMRIGGALFAPADVLSIG